MINDMKKDAEKRMKKSVEAAGVEFSKLRTGRAHPSLLDHVHVDYYGNVTPIAQVASVTASDSRTLTVTPWDKNMIPAIEKAIMTSDLGLNPVTSGTVIRVPMPALTEQRRKELIKVLRSEGEAARVSIRNIRRDMMNEFKALLKDKKITEDEERRAGEDIQKLTDKYVHEIDKLIEHKEKDLMEI